MAYERATARSSASAEVSAVRAAFTVFIEFVVITVVVNAARPTSRNAAICIPAANAITAVTTTDSVPAGKNPTTTSTPTSRPSVASCGAGVPRRRDHPHTTATPTMNAAYGTSGRQNATMDGSNAPIATSTRLPVIAWAKTWPCWRNV